MQRRLLAPFLVCALLALPACGNVTGVAKRSIVRFLSGTVTAMLFGSGEAAADEEELVAADAREFPGRGIVRLRLAARSEDGADFDRDLGHAHRPSLR